MDLSAAPSAGAYQSTDRVTGLRTPPGPQEHAQICAGRCGRENTASLARGCGPSEVSSLHGAAVPPLSKWSAGRPGCAVGMLASNREGREGRHEVLPGFCLLHRAHSPQDPPQARATSFPGHQGLGPAFRKEDREEDQVLGLGPFGL